MKQARTSQTTAASSERVRRSIGHNIKSSNDAKYVSGDQVYFKRRNQYRWHGPGTVIGQDGQIVLVKNQASIVRVHPGRLRLVKNKQWSSMNEKDSEIEEQTDIHMITEIRDEDGDHVHIGENQGEDYEEISEILDKEEEGIGANDWEPHVQITENDGEVYEEIPQISDEGVGENEEINYANLQPVVFDNSDETNEVHDGDDENLQIRDGEEEEINDANLQPVIVDNSDETNKVHGREQKDINTEVITVPVKTYNKAILACRFKQILKSLDIKSAYHMIVKPLKQARTKRKRKRGNLLRFIYLHFRLLS